jgi:hypothetical protein
MLYKPVDKTSHDQCVTRKRRRMNQYNYLGDSIRVYFSDDEICHHVNQVHYEVSSL